MTINDLLPFKKTLKWVLVWNTLLVHFHNQIVEEMAPVILNTWKEVEVAFVASTAQYGISQHH